MENVMIDLDGWCTLADSAPPPLSWSANCGATFGRRRGGLFAFVLKVGTQRRGGKGQQRHRWRGCRNWMMAQINDGEQQRDVAVAVRRTCLLWKKTQSIGRMHLAH